VLQDKEERVQVKAEVLDDFVNFAGEISIARSHVEQQVGEFKYSLEEMEQTIERLRGQLRALEIEAESLDYELLYKLPDGRTQGVPGTINLSGQKEIERDLLLGSESSGKFRYDEGVESGTLTLRFRNDKGKLLARFTTEFLLLSNTADLSSKDGNFEFKLSKTSKDVFFVVMETFGVPGEAPGEVVAGPYGLFSSDSASLSGTATIAEGGLYRWTGSQWSDKDLLKTGIFIGVSSE